LFIISSPTLLDVNQNLYKSLASKSIKICGSQLGLFVFAVDRLAGVALVVLELQDERGDYWQGEGPQNHVNKRDDIRGPNFALSITDVQAQFCLPAVKK
jgi:hypothetical protein